MIGNKIWFGWLHIPGGGVACAKICDYDKATQTCTLIFSGGFTVIEVPFKDMEPINGCKLPWED